MADNEDRPTRSGSARRRKTVRREAIIAEEVTAQGEDVSSEFAPGAEVQAHSGGVPGSESQLPRAVRVEGPVRTFQAAPAHVILDRGGVPDTLDEVLWDIIKDRTRSLSFTRYSQFIDQVFRDVSTDAPVDYDMGPVVEFLREHSDSAIEQALDTLDDPDLIQSDKDYLVGKVFSKAQEILDQNPGGIDPRQRQAIREQIKRRASQQRAVSSRGAPGRFTVFNGDAYQLLKTATEAYVYAEARRLEDVWSLEGARPPLSHEQYLEWKNEYLSDLEGELAGSHLVLPYMAIIRRRLAEVPLKEGLALGTGPGSYGILRTRLISPILVELIWNYWIEQGLMVQTINLVSLRFQNVRRGPGLDPLANLEIDPLRPLSNLLWGYLQDELNRLTVQRRAYEYAHGLGLQLVGKAVPEMHPADVRTQFLPAFHDLLRLAWTFFREDDDKTIAADAFPLLNALRELHFVISEGAHNQFGDLPLRARIEMLMQQWILGRPEMRDFLRGRTMVPYPEPWMDRVDAMKALQGWNDASVINYGDLATFGEQIILSVRYGSWSTTSDQDQAANWARAWRPSIQRYTHALRIVSGIDLSVGDVTEVRTGSERLAQGITAGRGATPGGTFNFPPSPTARSLPPRPGADRLLRAANPAGGRVRREGESG